MSILIKLIGSLYSYIPYDFSASTIIIYSANSLQFECHIEVFENGYTSYLHTFS